MFNDFVLEDVDLERSVLLVRSGPTVFSFKCLEKDTDKPPFIVRPRFVKFDPEVWERLLDDLRNAWIEARGGVQ